jgi:hypothetical protein
MVLIALVVFVAIGGFISTIPSEPKATPLAENVRSGQCGSGAGVSLVIDFGTSSNREVKELCVTEFESTGWDLFAAAAVSAKGTSEYPTGFVCRLDGLADRRGSALHQNTNCRTGFVGILHCRCWQPRVAIQRSRRSDEKTAMRRSRCLALC